MWPNVPAFSKAPLQAGSASCPGKIFLWGEYGILAGLPAWVLAVGPRFRATWGEPSPDSSAWAAHPESPLGRLLSRLEVTSSEWSLRVSEFRRSFVFQDAHSGLGGFGGSTAEFILGAYALGLVSESPASIEELWRIYRDLHSADAVLPSGADLVAQASGGCVKVRIQGADQGLGEMERETVSPALAGSCFRLYSASGIPGRKVATHRHLPELRDRGFFGVDSLLVRALKPWLDSVAQAMKSASLGSPQELGALIDGIADALHGLGLEHPSTHLERKKLRSLPGVFGVKGLGALQADALLVLCNPEPSVQNRVDAEALGLGLRPVALPVSSEPGLKAEDPT